MINKRGHFVDRAVTHTHTTESGAIIVVSNVPAQVYVDPDGREEIAYPIDVAERLDQILTARAVVAVPSKVDHVFYNDQPQLPDADYQISFDGPDIDFSTATLQVWRRILDKAYNAYKMASRAVSSKFPHYPLVAYWAPGSIVLGMRTSLQKSLFEFDYNASEETEKSYAVDHRHIPLASRRR